MTDEERIERGLRVYAECYGDVIPPPGDASPGSYTATNMKLFGEVWGDERLSFREKRLLVLGTLAGMGADPSLFVVHAKSALRNGELTPDELRAALLLIFPYVGFPNASPIHAVVEKLIAEFERG
jgi:4-carboxymuconolactone decarboxylase